VFNGVGKERLPVVCVQWRWERTSTCSVCSMALGKNVYLKCVFNGVGKERLPEVCVQWRWESS